MYVDNPLQRNNSHNVHKSVNYLKQVHVQWNRHTKDKIIKLKNAFFRKKIHSLFWKNNTKHCRPQINIFWMTCLNKHILNDLFNLSLPYSFTSCTGILYYYQFYFWWTSLTGSIWIYSFLYMYVRYTTKYINVQTHTFRNIAHEQVSQHVRSHLATPNRRLIYFRFACRSYLS